MIRTRVVEAFAGDLGKIEERELGWCTIGEVPVEKKRLSPQEAAQPFVLKVNGENMFVIGHSWDVTTLAVTAEQLDQGEYAGHPSLPRVPYELPDAILVLIVQRIPEAPSGLVKAPAAALDQLKAAMPPPGVDRLKLS